MKKTSNKLSLRTTTIRVLSQGALARAEGGAQVGGTQPVEGQDLDRDVTSACFIMKDSVIVKTSTR
jgi:hypothetical protein